jgi:hypothetical protein
LWRSGCANGSGTRAVEQGPREPLSKVGAWREVAAQHCAPPLGADGALLDQDLSVRALRHDVQGIAADTVPHSIARSEPAFLEGEILHANIGLDGPELLIGNNARVSCALEIREQTLQEL